MNSKILVLTEELKLKYWPTYGEQMLFGKPPPVGISSVVVVSWVVVIGTVVVVKNVDRIGDSKINISSEIKNIYFFKKVKNQENFKSYRNKCQLLQNSLKIKKWTS